MNLFNRTNKIIEDFQHCIENPVIPEGGGGLHVGVDLGTAYIVVVVLDESMKPLAGAYRFGQVVRDGLVVDFIGAVNIVRELKGEIEEKIGCSLHRAAVAVPPGTGKNDMKFIGNVVESAGMEVCNVVDEPTAANSVLGIENGVVVDIGGGTTGLAVIKDGCVVYTADEPTGGTQCSLVIAGSYKVSFLEAENMKKSDDLKVEISNVLKPVYQKIASIIKTHIEDYEIDGVYLVGGTSCLFNIEKVIQEELGIKTYKPVNPLFVTPIGIAMNCIDPSLDG